ncbi:MAG: (Na+)-NQR maturation NqrM [Acidobacteriota bacterium]|nr:(Na+)-NQR maturation NqrM [Acidobacteriota bacterium]
MVTTLLLTVGMFGLFFFMLGVGFFIRGVVLKGSCGGAAAVLGEESCGACAKKEAEICPTDDDTGLLNISNISNPHRTMKERNDPPPLQV